MKKVLYFLLALVIFGFASCGPSPEEKAKMEEEAAEAVDSLMNALEAEMGDDAEAEGEKTEEPVPTTKESEEAPKQ